MAEERNLRFGFVEMLFALTAAEIATQFAELATHSELSTTAAPAYAHLVLALILVTTSWVGWSMSKSFGNKRNTEKVFSADFIVLLIDVSLVIFYFIIVKSVEIEKGKEGGAIIFKTPSAEQESFWTMIVFLGYFAWDLMTDVLMAPDRDSNSPRPAQRAHAFTAWFRGAWNSVGISLVCFALAAGVWGLVRGMHSTAAVVLADAAIIFLILFFRALKQDAHGWTAFFLLAFSVALLSAMCVR